MSVTCIGLPVRHAAALLLALLGGVLCTAFIALLIAVYPPDASVTGVADGSSPCAFPEYQELVRGGHELDWLVASKSAGVGYRSFVMQIYDASMIEQAGDAQHLPLKRTVLRTDLGWPHLAFITNLRHASHRPGSAPGIPSTQDEASHPDGQSMAVQILWSGLCVNVLVFASIMLIPCAALHRRTANRFLPRALLVGLCAGLPSTLLVAWGCGLVHRDVQSVRQTSYGDPIEFGASVYLVTTPPSAEWDGFHGTAYTSFGGRSWQAQFTKDQGNNVAFAVACESSIALGWPLHCLSGPAIEHWRQRELADSVIAVTSIPAWWPGLLINWGFYALVITAALTLPTIILRAYRLRRGCCAACGYPLHELTRCPECGVDALRTM